MNQNTGTPLEAYLCYDTLYSHRGSKLQAAVTGVDPLMRIRCCQGTAYPYCGLIYGTA